MWNSTQMVDDKRKTADKVQTADTTKEGFGGGGVVLCFELHYHLKCGF